MSSESIAGSATHPIDDVLYGRLAHFAGSRHEDRGPSDRDLQATAEAAVCHEARLLDDRQYRAWLGHFSSDAVYWVPIDPETDPRLKISFMLDDKRRLEDRIALLETGWAHAQDPVSRVCRQVSNVEAWPYRGDQVWVRCTVAAWEYRRDKVTPFVSRNDYLVSGLESTWSIHSKIVSLLNSAGDVRKFPFIL